MSLNHRLVALVASSLVASVALATVTLQDAPKTPPAPAAPAAPAPAPAAPQTPAAAPLPANAPKGDEVVKAYIDAIGGKDAIAAITSSHYKGELDMMMGKVQIDVATMAPNKLRLVQGMSGAPNAPGTSVETCSDGTIGWTTNPMTGKPELLDPEMVAAMRDGSDFQALVRTLDKSFGDFTTTSESTFEGTACWSVTMKAKTGEPSTAFFDKESKLLKGIRQEQQTPQGMATATVTFTDWTDYPVDKAKVKVFHGITIAQEGMRITGTFSDFAFNTQQASFFDAPEAVKELAKAAEAAKAKPAEAPAAPAAPAAPSAPAAPATDAPVKK